jgi:hypothetical protein
VCAHLSVYIVPLVVVFTKRDGLVTKITNDILGRNASDLRQLSWEKLDEAMAEAEVSINKHLEERKEEVKKHCNGKECMFSVIGGKCLFI